VHARDEFRCTYRLQLRPGFGFREAKELVPYLQRLGDSHLYLSPVLEARAASTHGYDVVDPTRVSDDLGGEAELRALCGADLDVIVDVVPNHMAASDENPYWRDPERRPRVFDIDPETGRHGRFFDVDELAGVRVEDPDVFETTHGKVLELVRGGLVQGLLAPLTELYAELTGERRSFTEVAHEAKLEQARTTFRPEFDVRARLAALAGMPDEWAAFARPRVGAFDDPNEGYFALQTLVGAWPLKRERLDRFEKALREAKVSTSWVEPDIAHESPRGRRGSNRFRSGTPRARRAGRRARAGDRRCDDAPQAHGAGRPRPLPGRRARGAVARRSG
jgi:maltooligosyltrehalose synthase